MILPDHNINSDDLLKALKVRAREIYLEDGRLIEINSFVKKINPNLFEVFAHFDITRNLAQKIIPFGEDQVKDVSFEERIYDMLRSMPSGRMVQSVDWPDPQINFEFKIKTYVKSSKGIDEIKTHSKGSETKTVNVYVMMFPNRNGKSGLLFGLRKE